jgi:fibronectin type 3 domain-containing protein
MMKLSRCKTLYKAVSWIIIFTFLFTIWGGAAIPVLAAPSGAVSPSVHRDVYAPKENNDDSPADALNSIHQAPAAEKEENEGQTASAPADELSASAPVITLSEIGNNSPTDPANDAFDSAIIREATTDATLEPEAENAPPSSPKESVPSSKANTPQSNSPTTLIFDGYRTISVTSGSSDINNDLGSLSNAEETVKEDVYEEDAHEEEVYEEDNQNTETENGIEDGIEDAVENGNENDAEDSAEDNKDNIENSDDNAINDETNDIIEEIDQEQPLTMNMFSGDQPITHGEWYFDPEIISSHDNMCIWLSASFISAEDITAIEYVCSQDGENWIEIDGPMIIEDWQGVFLWDDGAWWRDLYVDFSGFDDGPIIIRATATDALGNTLSVEETIIKDTVVENVRDLSIEPNEDNNGLVLSWTKGADYEYALVYKYVSEGDGEEGWELLGDTNETSYIDFEVRPKENYTYKVIAVDQYDNEAMNPPIVTGSLRASPIYFIDMYLDGDTVGSYNRGNFYMEACFMAEKEITSIEYEYSQDRNNWQSLDSFIVWDEGVCFDEYAEVWYRNIEVDFTTFSDGTYYLKAIATDADGNTLSYEKEIIINAVVDDVYDLSVAPNADNTALVLSWKNPEDFEYADIYIYVPFDDDYGEWHWLGRTSESSYTDFGVRPKENYTYMVVACNSEGNEAENPPTVTGCLREAPIYLINWYQYDDVVGSWNNQYFGIEAGFMAEKEITSIEYEYSQDRNDWHSLEPFVVWDDELYNYEQEWYRYIEVDFTSFTDGTYYLRATATDTDNNSLAVERELIIKTVADNVMNLQVAPNEENNALVLTWENPDEFDYMEIYRSVFDGENQVGDWERIKRVYVYWENSYIDTNVNPYFTYKYKIVVWDYDGNRSADEPTVTGKLTVTAPITFYGWDLNYDGVVTPDYKDEYYICSSFIGENDITSIEYAYSSDQINWHSLDDLIIYDGGLSFNNYDLSWYRVINVDFTELADGTYYLKATATDTSGNSLSVEREFRVDTIAENVVNLQVKPNEENNALILTWENPDEFYRGEIYRWVYDSTNPSEKWNYIRTVYGETSYTDTNVSPYKTYYYKIVTYDSYWNQSVDEPRVSGTLYNEGPFSFQRWYLTDENIININNAGSFYIGAVFNAENEMTAIDFNYSSDGEVWQSLEPLKTYDYGFSWYSSYNEGYREARYNLSSLPDGDIWLQAVGHDVLGNSFQVNKKLYKDITRPADVTDFIVEVNEDKTALVLSWVNPAADFDHVVVQRRMYANYSFSTLSSNVTEQNYIDNSVTPGLEYEYRILTVDGAGNVSNGSESRFGVIPVDAPVLDGFLPSDGAETSHTNIYYKATFIDDQEILSIAIEISTDGENWILLNEGNTTPERSNNYFSVDGYWDLTAIGEEVYQVRATAVDVGGRTTVSDIHWVTVDRLPPDAPTNFKAENVSNGIHITWDSMPGTDYYYLQRYVPSGDDWSYSNYWYIYEPDHSCTDIYAARDTVYRYSVYAVDELGNRSETVYTIGEYFIGPELELERGIYTATNNSTYTLKGQTEPGATVTVNGASADVDAEGVFSYDLTLIEGSNIITVAATDGTGTHTKKQTVILDTQIPTIYFFTPGNNTTIGGSNVSIDVEARDGSNSKIELIDIQVSPDDGVNWYSIGTLTKDQLYHSSYYSSGTYEWDSTAEIEVYGKLSDGSYKFRAIAHDRAGNVSDGSTVRIWILDNTPPAPPANVTATGAADKITLTWAANVETDLHSSDRYRIYRSTSSGTGYEYITYTSSTSYTDTNVQLGVDYYYVITARDKVGNESSYSLEVSASPLADVTAPQVTYITAAGYTLNNGSTIGGPSIELYFRATDNSPKGIANFLFEYSGDEGTSWTEIASGKPYSSSSYYYRTEYWDTTGLISGNYILRFSAEDYAGNIGYQERTVILDVFASDPANLIAESGEGTVTLTWDAVPDTDFSRYEVWRSESAEDGFSRIGSYITNKNTTTYTDNTGTIGTTYYYIVKHRDTRGNYGVSEMVSARLLDDMTPPEVTQITISSPGSGTSTGGPEVRFNARATDNKEIASMDAEFSLDGGNTWSSAGITKSGISKYTDYYQITFYWNTEGLSSGTYLIRVKAKDQAGNEAYLTIDQPWTLDLTVSAVTNLAAIPGDGSITLDWDPVPDPDLKAYYPYIVYRSETPGVPYTYVTSIYSKSTTEYENTGLAPNTTYYYVVESVDNFENKARSEEVSATTLADGTPPNIISINPSNNTKIGGPGATNFSFRVDFTDASGSGGARAEIKYSLDGGEWISIEPVYGPYFDSSYARFYFYGSVKAEDLSTGTLSVHYMVYDRWGNLAERTATYPVDLTPPLPGNGTAHQP